MPVWYERYYELLQQCKNETKEKRTRLSAKRI